MDITGLVARTPFAWSPIGTGEQGIGDIVLYGSRELMVDMDDKVLEQARNVARLPGLVGAVSTMPDAHWGYGFPIGGVAAFDADAGGIISAGGVGFDISCGIRCLRTDLQASDLAGNTPALAHELSRAVPAGVGREGRIHLAASELDEMLLGGANWAVEHGYGTRDELEYVEERGVMAGADPGAVSQTAKRRQRGEMGTLGSGNHYFEVQVVEEIFDTAAADAFGLRLGQVVVCIHCGSRGLGHQIGTDYLVEMARSAAQFGIALADRELACAPIRSDLGQRYLGAMRAGINCALANRQVLAEVARGVFGSMFPGARLETLYDVSHNTCKVEWHEVEGRRRELYVHRKGATRAYGPGHPTLPVRYREHGQPVIIGGSMGTASYVLRGTTESESLAWSSASHGAGRAMSRHEALRRWQGRAIVDQLAREGIVIRSASMRGIAEEAPDAYKDVHSVAEATENAGLAARVALLRPRICVKG